MYCNLVQHFLPVMWYYNDIILVRMCDKKGQLVITVTTTVGAWVIDALSLLHTFAHMIILFTWIC